jgi:hypothetical protein
MQPYLRYWQEVFRLPVIPREGILGWMRCTGEEETAFAHMAAAAPARRTGQLDTA